MQKNEIQKMNYKIEESNLIDKLNELNIEIPDSLTFIPENISEVNDKNDFVFTDSTTDFKKVFKLNELSSSELDSDSSVYRSRKSADFFAPALFISLSMLSENQHLVAIAINLASEYCKDLFKGTIGKKTVKLDIYVETNKKKTVKKISYEGDSEGIKDLTNVIKSLK
ncbi:hypothetical protein [Tenacibaculum jejuense]|uniref:Uncharacterized protein n=1 Tax=Tenacibaculum jejuense TaxID=584609 RepID=A0A238U6V9_9FLAO|nr:hypothetical protein [Tenacibaculum jejuense]SNR14746.1 conserved protein of unknown function [Tenacibaculum jejuense]